MSVNPPLREIRPATKTLAMRRHNIDGRNQAAEASKADIQQVDDLLTERLKKHGLSLK